MKVIIAGGREFKADAKSALWLVELLKELNPEEIVSGCAKGADTFGELVAEKLKISVKKFPANWELYGKAAGTIRNEQMANYADICILFPGGKGTNDMCNRAKQHGLKIYEYL